MKREESTIEPSAITRKQIQKAAEWLFSGAPIRSPLRLMTGKLGYYNYLESLGEGDGFVDKSAVGQPDGYMTVKVDNKDGTCTYFVDRIKDNVCIDYIVITEEEYITLDKFK